MSWCSECGDAASPEDICQTCGACDACCECDISGADDSQGFDSDEFGEDPEAEFERRFQR